MSPKEKLAEVPKGQAEPAEVHQPHKHRLVVRARVLVVRARVRGRVGSDRIGEKGKK